MKNNSITGSPATSPLASLTFMLAAIFCLTPYSSPGIALAVGLTMALTLGNPWSQAD